MTRGRPRPPRRERERPGAARPLENTNPLRRATRHKKTAPHINYTAIKRKTCPDIMGHPSAPPLRRDHPFGIDHPPAPKAAGRPQTVEAPGPVPPFPPQFSPEFNPVRMAFSKAQGLPRKMAEPTISPPPRRNRTFPLIPPPPRPKIFLARRVCPKSNEIGSSSFRAASMI